jgi:hypothetical protein
MAKYYVSCESVDSSGLGFSMSSILGFSLRYFTVEIDPPINAKRLWEMINKDQKYKTGNVVSWSKIEE